MNEKSIKNIIDLLTVMSEEIKDLKQWRAEQEQRQAEEDAKAEESQREFEDFINRRRAEEKKRAEDAEKLKKFMM